MYGHGRIVGIHYTHQAVDERAATELLNSPPSHVDRAELVHRTGQTSSKRTTCDGGQTIEQFGSGTLVHCFRCGKHSYKHDREDTRSHRQHELPPSPRARDDAVAAQHVRRAASPVNTVATSSGFQNGMSDVTDAQQVSRALQALFTLSCVHSTIIAFQFFNL